MSNYQPSSEELKMSCVEPLLDTWGAKKNGADWCISPAVDLTNSTVKERNTWLAEAMMSTIKAFAPLARAYRIYFDPIEKIDKLSQGEPADDVIDGILMQWDFEESYETYLERAFQALKSYPLDIYILYIDIDLFVYVRTQKSLNKPFRTWVRRLSESIVIAKLQISLDDLMNYEPFLYFAMGHTLIYPYYDKFDDDNTELFELNRPLLAAALRNWEQAFNFEIETEGFPGIYKYGFLPGNQ